MAKSSKLTKRDKSDFKLRGYLGILVNRIVSSVLILLAATTACNSVSDEQLRAPGFLAAPRVVMQIDGEVPLAGHLSVVTTVPSRIGVELTDENGHALQVQFDVLATTHEKLLLGLRPDRNYLVVVTAYDSDGKLIATAGALNLQTPPLPADFPPLEVLISEPLEMEPGFTMFSANAMTKTDGAPKITSGFLVIVDNAGEVVWYLRGIFTIAKRLPNGNLIVLKSKPDQIAEIDMSGQIAMSWFAANSDSDVSGHYPVATRDFHHDVVPLENPESYLTLVRDFRMIRGFPTDEDDRTKVDRVKVRDEPILEFSPGGLVVRQWSLLDILKPDRIGFDATRGLPDDADWAHANAVYYDSTDDSMLVSLRHQDAVVKISRRSGRLKWILGTHDNWQGFEKFLLSPSGENFRWQYHQHSPTITPQGTLILFDNGNYRASPFTGQTRQAAMDSHSRAVEYAIDEESMTVTQLWEWSGENIGEQLYSPIVGDANYMDSTGNILMSFAGLCHEDGVPSDKTKACLFSFRIIEVARNKADRRVFDLRIVDPTGSVSWVSYRSERLESLYADGTMVNQ